MDNIITFEATEERKVIPIQDIFDVSSAVLQPMRETITTTEYALDDLPGLMNAGIDSGSIDLSGLADGGHGVVYVTTTTTTQLIEAPPSDPDDDDDDNNNSSRRKVTTVINGYATTTTTTSSKRDADVDASDAALISFSREEDEKREFYRQREKERKRLIRNQVVKLKKFSEDVVTPTVTYGDDEEDVSVEVTDTTVRPTSLQVLPPVAITNGNGHDNRDDVIDQRTVFYDFGRSPEPEPGEVDRQSILDNKDKVKEFLTNRMLENPPSPVIGTPSRSPGTSGSNGWSSPTTTKSSTTMLLTNGNHAEMTTTTTNNTNTTTTISSNAEIESTEGEQLFEARPCFIEPPSRVVQTSVTRSQTTTSSGTDSWIAKEIEECRLRDEELKRSRLENNNRNATYTQSSEPSSMTDSLMSQDSQLSALTGSSEHDDVSLPTPPPSSLLSSPSPSPTPAGFVFPEAASEEEKAPSPASMLSNDEWLLSSEKRQMGKVRPLVDSDSDEERGPVYRVSNETAVERDIRLSREREEELRKEKERVALRLFSESTRSEERVAASAVAPLTHPPPPPPEVDFVGTPEATGITFMQPTTESVGRLVESEDGEEASGSDENPVAKELALERERLALLQQLSQLRVAHQRVSSLVTVETEISSKYNDDGDSDEPLPSNADDDGETAIQREIRVAREREEELTRDRSVTGRQISAVELDKLIGASSTAVTEKVAVAVHVTDVTAEQTVTSQQNEQWQRAMNVPVKNESLAEEDSAESVGSDTSATYRVLKESAVERDIRLSREREEELKREKEMRAAKLADKLKDSVEAKQSNQTKTSTLFLHMEERVTAPEVVAGLSEAPAKVAVVVGQRVASADVETKPVESKVANVEVEVNGTLVRQISQEFDREVVSVSRGRASPLVAQSAPTANGVGAGQFPFPVGGNATLNRLPAPQRALQSQTSMVRCAAPKGAMEKFIANKGKMPAFSAFAPPKAALVNRSFLSASPSPASSVSSPSPPSPTPHASAPTPPPENGVAIVVASHQQAQVQQQSSVEKVVSYKRSSSVIESKIQVELREMELREEELRKQRDLILASKLQAVSQSTQAEPTVGSTANGHHNGVVTDNGNAYANGSSETLIAFNEARKRFK